MATPRNSAQEGRSGPEVRETAHNRVDPDRPATPGFGRSLRSAREAAGLTLERLAVACGCARSYLSLMENGRKGPPSEELLARLEIALGLEAGGPLTRAARLERTPAAIRDDLEASRRLAELLRGTSLDERGRVVGRLDAAYRTGELARLTERLMPASGTHAEPVGAPLPREVPLINRVAAGYPAGFTDLGYPARAADEYVRCPDLEDPDAFAARVVGDSMEPDYREGDIVVFSPARDVVDGSDCFARLEPDDETTFKRVYFETGEDGGGLIRLQPVNNRYPPRVLERELVAGLYRAVSVTRSL